MFHLSDGGDNNPWDGAWDCHLVGLSVLGKVVRHRVLAPCYKGMAATNPRQAHDEALEGTVFFNGMNSIGGTGWTIATTRREQWR